MNYRIPRAKPVFARRRYGWLVAQRVFVVCVIALSGGITCADDIVVVVGAEGTPEYGTAFRDAASTWQSLAEANNFGISLIGLEESESDRDVFEKKLTEFAGPESPSPLWVVLLGHGTFADGVAKFNTRGIDFSAAELSEWLREIRRPIIIVNGASSSGPFINRLSGKNRIVVTGTKSGSELNYTRFGAFFAESIASRSADLDHDEEVSVHEAFVMASRKVESFYQSESRLSTEHALLDDNGDSAGSPLKMVLAEMKAARSGDDSKQKAVDGKFSRKISLSPDGSTVTLSDEQLSERDKLESQLETLQQQRDRWDETQYLQKLLPIMVQLAKLYDEG